MSGRAVQQAISAIRDVTDGNGLPARTTSTKIDDQRELRCKRISRGGLGLDQDNAGPYPNFPVLGGVSADARWRGLLVFGSVAGTPG
jgi:hypothetical protein